MSMLSELQDFYKRRAEVEVEYSRSLDKMIKQIMSRHKAEKQKYDHRKLTVLHDRHMQFFLLFHESAQLLLLIVVKSIILQNCAIFSKLIIYISNVDLAMELGEKIRLLCY